MCLLFNLYLRLRIYVLIFALVLSVLSKQKIAGGAKDGVSTLHLAANW